MNSKTIINTISQSHEASSGSLINLPKLSFCVLMDLAGVATYALPGLGEWGDMLWAPISALIFFRTFGGMTGAIGSVVNMAEELLPFTDFIPTFTIGYFYTKYQMNKGNK